nr:uncharacterized protein LOC123286418 isoform X2 [Equus asinus]
MLRSKDGLMSQTGLVLAFMESTVQGRRYLKLLILLQRLPCLYLSLTFCQGLSYPWLWKNLRNSAHLEKMHGMSCSPLPFTARPSSCLKEFTVFAGRQDKCTDIRKRCGECQEQEKWPNVQWEVRAMPMEARTRLKMVKMMTSKKPALKLKASWHDGKGVNIKAKLPRGCQDHQHWTRSCENTKEAMGLMPTHLHLYPVSILCTPY